MNVIVSTTMIAVAAVLVMAIVVLESEQRSNGVAIPLTKQSSFVNSDKSVDFDALNDHAELVMAKIAHGLYNYEKNIGTTHPVAVTGSLIRNRGAGMALTTFKKNIWYGPIAIGNSPNSFSVMFDTGSGDLFVPSVTCDTSCGEHTRWDPTQSINAHALGKECQLEYADKSTVEGAQYAVNVSIAGFTASSQTLCAATKYSAGSRFGDKNKFPPDGIMGMGFPSISAQAATPLFITLVTEKKVTNQVFSFNLSSSGGELYIGGANRRLYKGDFTFTPVTKQAFWQVKVENVKGKEEPISGLYGIDAIVDTGCNFIIGDESRIKQLHKVLGGVYYHNGFYIYPCDSFPVVSLTFNGKSFQISASTQNVGPIQDGSHYCWSGIVGRQNKEHAFWSIGGVFLQNVYTSFDYGNQQVGFAEHSNS